MKRKDYLKRRIPAILMVTVFLLAAFAGVFPNYAVAEDAELTKQVTEATEQAEAKKVNLPTEEVLETNSEENEIEPAVPETTNEFKETEEIETVLEDAIEEAVDDPVVEGNKDIVEDVLKSETEDQENTDDEALVKETEEKAEDDEEVSEDQETAKEMRANRDPEQISPLLTTVEFEVKNVENPNVYRYHHEFKIEMGWDATSYGNTLIEGDYFIVDLPKGIRPLTDPAVRNFDLYAPDGVKVIGKGVITDKDGGGSQVRITFTEFVERRYDVKGTFYVSTRFVREEIKYDEPTDFVFSIGSSVQTVGGITITGPNKIEDEFVTKWSERPEDAPGEIRWVIRLNHKKADAKNVVIHDKLTVDGASNHGMKYIEGSFTIQEVEMDEYGFVTGGGERTSFTPTFNDDKNEFSYTIPDLGGKQYIIRYRSTYEYGYELRNNVTITSSIGEHKVSSSFRSEDSGGTGDGNLIQKIKIVKVDKNNNEIKLAGAEFEIYKEGSNEPIETLKTDANGEAVTKEKLAPGTYILKEITAPEGYELLEDNIEVTVEEGKVAIKTIENEKTPSIEEPETVDITGKKVWEGLEVGETPPTIKLQLYRNGQKYGDPIDLESGTEEHKWTNLPKFDENGDDYVYTVDEVEVPAGYTKKVSGLTVTNTKTPPTPEKPKTEITGVKKWVGESGTKPTIEMQLFRNGIALGDPVEFADGKTTHTWKDLDLKDEEGKDYVYTVDEVDVPEGYTKKVNGLTVTNTKTPDTPEPPKKDVTGTKIWVGGSGPRPTITLQLYRNGRAYGDPVELKNGTTKYTWKDLDVKDANGNDYVYTIDEVSVPTGYTKKVSGLTVTNTKTPPVTPGTPKKDVTGTKVWVGGEGPRPTIKLQLFRNGTPYGDPVELVDGTTRYTWRNLEVKDSNGKDYVYTVDEVEVPAGYTKKASGLTVTNTKTPPTPEKPKTEITGVKKWVGESGTKPTIKMQLFRNGIALGDPVEFADGKTTHTWKDLDLKDENGKDYVYTVDEVAVPEGYTKSVSGLTVTNTKTPPASPKIEITGVKKWIGGKKNEVKPTIQMQLYRNGKALGDPVEFKDGKTSHTWKELDQKDENGKDYVYTVDEVKVPNGYKKTVKGLTITNTYVKTPVKTPGKTTGKTLPKTGSDDPIFIVLGVGLIITSLFLLRKRKNEQ